MAILSLNKLEAKGFKSKLSNKLKFYKGDRLNLGFSISSDLINNIGSKEVVNGILPIDSDNIEAKMLIEGHEIEGTIIEDNNVVFLLEPKHQTVGVTQFQIVIIEYQEDGSKEILHTPPFPIEIAEPIGYYDGTEQARVGYALVGKSRVAAPPTVTASIDYEYNMTVWETGDLITADRLNNIEMALDSLLYIGPTPPTDPNIKIWVDTSKQHVDSSFSSLVIQEFRDIISSLTKKISVLEKEVAYLKAVIGGGDVPIEPEPTNDILLVNEDGFILVNENGDILCSDVYDMLLVNEDNNVLVNENNQILKL